MKQKLSAAGLKTLAVIAMTVDHAALLFVPQDNWFYWLVRMFGRLTAPIMAFFIAEGFQHTSSRKKYFLRLLSFALISQPLYFHMVYGRMPNSIPEFFMYWNVMFSLAVALLSLIVLESGLPETPRLILVALCISLGHFGDWSLMIPVWAVIFYLFRKNFRMKAIMFVIASITLQTMIFAKYYDSFALFSFQYGTLLSLIPLRMYNGQSGAAKYKKLNRWVFYIYYPLHMAVLIFIRTVLV